MSTQQTRLIFGLGTGRSGTKSLTRLLDACTDGPVRHEMHPHLPWAVDEALLQARLDGLASLESDVAGDVGFYYLPYVEAILQRHPDSSFIVLRRDREATIRSYIRKADGRNHWVNHDGRRWRADPTWDPCYPKYAVEGIEEAVGCYWDEYYRTVEDRQRLFPHNVRVWPMEALNDVTEVRQILSFSGLDPELSQDVVGARTNTGRQSLRARTRSALRRGLRR